MKGSMRVGMYYNNRDVRLQEMPIPETGDKDILIKVIASGICGTDIMEWYRIKKAPMVQGHEIAGEIVEVGKDITEYKVGDRVFATHHVPCGCCRDCLRGNGTSCDEFQKVNNFYPGGFAEYVRVTGKSVKKGILKLPGNVYYEQGSFIEPLGSVVEGVDLEKGGTVLVLGSGVAGLLTIKYARIFPKVERVIATDINDKRLEYAKKFGADYVINANEYSPDKLREVNDGRLADAVVVCAGAKSATEQALLSFGKGAQIIHFATPKEGEKVERDDFVNWRTGLEEKRTYGASPGSCKIALEYITYGLVKVDELITHRLSLEEIAEGFRIASQGEGLKVIIQP